MTAKTASLSLVKSTKTARVRKPKLSVVQPDLEALARVVSEAAAQTAPITSRAVALRNEQQIRANELTRERQDFEDRKALLTSQYQAAMNGLDEHVADIDAALAIVTGGIWTAAASDVDGQ